MKNLFKKLHIMSNPNQSEDSGEGSVSSRGSHNHSNNNNNRNKSIDASSSSSSRSNQTSFSSTTSSAHDHGKPLSGLSGWLNSISNRHSSNLSVLTRGERAETSDAVSAAGGSGLADVALVELLPPKQDSSPSNSQDPEVEEEYQIQLALELSAREDPEAVQIEAVKQISLGTCAPNNTPAEVVAYRYWNYNVLGYDDKILDGFYDLYGILNDSAAERMPPLVDLQGTPVSGNVTWEAVLVNKAGDSNLQKLEQIALEMALKSRPDSLVQKLAILVSDYMGGPVGKPENMLREWQNLTHQLKATIGSMVLPLGSLKVGLARHRALLFKVLADSVNIPCRLVKGQQYTGSSDVAMNFVKLNDGREYIVDLMSDPGTLIPSDAAGSHIEYDESFFSTSPMSRDIDSSRAASSSSWVGSSFEEHSDFGTSDKRPKSKNPHPDEKEEKQAGPSEVEAEAKMPSDESRRGLNHEKGLCRELSGKSNYPYAHARSPSWTEGVSSPAVRKKKVKDVSKYMIDAAKENPRLAQKLHDVLLESGVVAPPNLFTEAYPEPLDVTTTEELRESKENTPPPPPPACFLPPLPHPRAAHSKPSDHMKVVENLAGHIISSQAEISPMKYAKNVPVAAAAAAAAAVVASSMVVAVAKSSADTNLDLPVAAAATATAAAVVATTAAVTKQYEQGMRSDGDTDSGGYEPPRGSGDREHESLEGERISDKSVGNESTKSDTMESVADCEILWEDITIGERIGLGSYGEVYRGEWHGTEVAVKRFLDQDITGESLAEFIKEVQIMKKLRHPNVVLFMGAVTRPPNLSIVTEFLPRGSLYRLLHRPNNQLDERRRLRMALDAARGMNYLHSSSPVIVHRDLKSPNLLVDKNWVVKVCDFGLSKMKHSTFLSSRSTAGTAEWMAPEVLQNEPSDEKCDVYSFGVILWELSTMQQPWNGMNPMQVVGAVGFQHRRLEIPDNLDPTIADIIRGCWQADPKLRPSFAEIMASLKPLQRPISNSSQVLRPNAMSRERVQQSRIEEESGD